MHENARQMLFTAFDLGITHFDLANNYGPPPGSAEERVGQILKNDLHAHRDELIISTKAGYRMWPGPYGEWGSRKYLLASLDQSLKRMQLDYVDIFYSHRPDTNTPLDETLGALDSAVKQGKAIYTGISSYDAPLSDRTFDVCALNGLVKPVIHQPSYSMLNRWIEKGLLDVAEKRGFGLIPFCPLDQGLLTNKYLKEIPKESRAAHEAGFLKAERITPALQQKLRSLNDLAQEWGGTLAQLALKWVLRDPRVTTALIGASRPEQITECAAAVGKPALSDDLLQRIETVLAI